MWHYFNLITYISVALWLLSGTLIYSKSKALRNLSITAHLVATPNHWSLYCCLVAKLRSSALAHPCRNTYLVRILYGTHRLCHLLALSPKVDAQLFSCNGDCIYSTYLYPPRYNEQSPNACLAERVVHSTRNRVYLCLCNVRDGFTHCFLWHLSL